MSRPDPAGRRPTMRDVARAAGVSPALVSIVFRGAPGASGETRARVHATARELGYVRDARARALRSLRPTSIGVTFRLDQPFQSEIVSALYESVPLATHSIMLSPTSESRSEESAIDDLVGNRCGVLVLVSSQLPSSRVAAIAAQIPVVSVAQALEGPGIDWVTSDERGGIALAVGHLRELGHRDIVYLSDEGSAGGAERLDGFAAASRALGIEDTVGVVPAGPTEDSGVVALERLLAQGRIPTAVVGFNDRCALGAMEYLMRQGLRVPEDVSVVGFDDSEVASRRLVQMTSVRQAPAALAEEAARMALARFGAAGERTSSEGVLQPTTLIVRSTTAAPGAGAARPR